MNEDTIKDLTLTYLNEIKVLLGLDMEYMTPYQQFHVLPIVEAFEKTLMESLEYLQNELYGARLELGKQDA